MVPAIGRHPRTILATMIRIRAARTLRCFAASTMPPRRCRTLKPKRPAKMNESSHATRDSALRFHQVQAALLPFRYESPR
jgi:hypothetical protein